MFVLFFCSMGGLNLLMRRKLRFRLCFVGFRCMSIFHRSFLRLGCSILRILVAHNPLLRVLRNPKMGIRVYVLDVEQIACQLLRPFQFQHRCFALRVISEIFDVLLCFSFQLFYFAFRVFYSYNSKLVYSLIVNFLHLPRQNKIWRNPLI